MGNGIDPQISAISFYHESVKDHWDGKKVLLKATDAQICSSVTPQGCH